LLLANALDASSTASPSTTVFARWFSFICSFAFCPVSGRDVRGGWWWFERVQISPAEGLPFPCKVLQSVGQGDARRHGCQTRTFCRTRRIQGRQTMPAPVPSPCKLFKWNEVNSVHPTLVRYRIRIPVGIGSRFLFPLRARILATMHVGRAGAGCVSDLLVDAGGSNKVRVFCLELGLG
jgi:hypothetical protein